MRYIGLDNYGGPELLHIKERPKPSPQPGEVLIEVQAAGINRPDCFQRQGLYPAPPGASDILGLEVSGKIVGCGEGVTLWKVGDLVCALLAGGGYAEYACAPEGQCLPIPPQFDFFQAAALPETFFTVWTNLYESGRLQKGESILVHGGSGGIGTTAIQMAHTLGSEVFTTVGKRESIQVCQQLGAKHVILYKEEDFESAILTLTKNCGVDVILDMVGGAYFTKNLECLATRGRLVQIATLQGSQVNLDLRKVMSKRLILTGSTLRPRSVEEKSRIGDALAKNIWPHLKEGAMKPVLYKVLPLAQAAEAHRLMENNEHIGKIVLQVR